MMDEKILDLEENWHRRKIKKTINIHREVFTKQRHWPGTPAGHTPAYL